ncbi:MAG TPA: hypothetical protein VGH80_14615 [Xanthomonadaceae bacterium]
MNENDERIVALLTQIRDNQREAIDLTKTSVSRQRTQVRVYYIASALSLVVMFYLVYFFFRH